jgi:5'-phosphate synthase pdxT subunit
VAGSTGADQPAQPHGDGPLVGVLALQGDVREHVRVREGFGARTRLVRQPKDLPGLSGLVIPGGESTVMDKLSRQFGVAEPLRAAIDDGLPVYGTCAGLIMLADEIVDAIHDQRSIGGLGVAVRRNAFGSQTASFEVDLDVPELGDPPVHAVFIRAPVVASTAEGVTRLAELDDGRVVAVRQGALLGTSFHPEVTGDLRFHRYFLDMVEEAGRTL